jgi:hypothetical protein
VEKQRSLDREARHEINQGLKEFERAKNSTIQLERVKLEHDSKSIRANETFQEMVQREIGDEDAPMMPQNLERLRVVSKMGMIPKDGDEVLKEPTSSKKHPKGEYIDMKKDKMVAYIKAL